MPTSTASTAAAAGPSRPWAVGLDVPPPALPWATFSTRPRSLERSSLRSIAPLPLVCGQSVAAHGSTENQTATIRFGFSARRMRVWARRLSRVQQGLQAATGAHR